MNTQLITWTALPEGIEHDFVRLAVFVSPRLGNDQNIADMELKDFPDFLKWYTMLEDLEFRVSMDSGWSMKIAPDLAQLQPELWDSLFKDETYVRAYQFPDYTQRPIFTYPVSSVVAYLKDIYQQVGLQSPSSLPGIPTSDKPNAALGKLISDIGDLLDRRQKEQGYWIENIMKELKVFAPGKFYPNFGFSNKTEQDFFQVNRFYRRPEDEEFHYPKPDPSKVPPRPEKPKLDFHQALASLGDHPAILTRLGILLHLLIPLEQFRDNHGGTMVRVEPSWSSDHLPSPFNQDRSPWTKFLLTKKYFLAQPRHGSPLKDGQLNLEGVSDQLENSKTVFHLLQVDPDGMAIKALDFAGTMRNLTIKIDSQRAAIDTQQEVGLPSLQTGGLALVADGRAYRLYQHFLADQSKNADLLADNLVLYADDLLRGYRVDIYDEATQRWRSLCRREGKYIFHNSGHEVPLDDEGYVKSASTTSKDDSANSNLYFHEAMFKWNGWSLVAVRPGKTIVREEISPGVTEENVRPVRNTPETEFGLETVVKAKPESLPRLRFGHSYRMRVRAVDMGGGGLPYTSLQEQEATRAVHYGRYEPLAPPTLVLRSLMTEGESVERMVIRSNFNHSASDYVVLPEVLAATAGKDYGGYQPANERHVVPPKTSQLMAELHGMFDPFFAPGSYQAGYNIALKEEGTLFDKDIVDTATGNKVPLPDPSQVMVITAPPNADGETPDQYVIHKEAQLLLPYLPDPVGR
ncbi:MAG: hypothetical protein HXY24_13135, partial [Rubrivivax sp.]|nr:hypothetical protein [Rubrivivax sp.]